MTLRKQLCSNKASKFKIHKIKKIAFPFLCFQYYTFFVYHVIYLNFDANYEVYLFAANLICFMMETNSFYYRQKSTLKRQLIMRRLVGIITLE